MSQIPGQPPPPPPPPSHMPYASQTTDPSERTFAMLCHLIALVGLAIPLGNIIGPLIIWLVKKEQCPFVDDQGKESLNFQMSLLIYALVCVPLCFIVIGFILLPLLGLFWLVMTIIAGIKANNGERYRYPLTIRFLQ